MHHFDDIGPLLKVTKSGKIGACNTVSCEQYEHLLFLLTRIVSTEKLRVYLMNSVSLST